MLDRLMQGPIDNIWRVSATLEQWYETGERPTAALGTASRLEPAHHNYIEQLHLVSLQQAARRAAKGKGNAKRLRFNRPQMRQQLQQPQIHAHQWKLRSTVMTESAVAASLNSGLEMLHADWYAAISSTPNAGMAC